MRARGSLFLLFIMLGMLGVIVTAAGTLPFPVEGIESGVKTVQTSGAVISITETYGNPLFTASTLFHGFAFSAINMPPQASYYLMSTSSSASATQIQISYATQGSTFLSISICWIVMATQEPIFVSMQNIPNPTTSTQITVGDLPSSFPKTMHAKVATLISGMNYKPLAPSTAFQLKVTPAIAAIDPAYSDYVTQMTNGIPSPFTSGNKLNLDIVTGPSATVAEISIAIVVHQVQPSVGPDEISIVGGYYVASTMNSARQLKISNQLINSLPNLNPNQAEFFYGFTQLTANGNAGLVVGQKILSTQLVGIESQSSNPFDAAGFIYITRNTVGNPIPHLMEGCLQNGCTSTAQFSFLPVSAVTTSASKSSYRAVDNFNLILQDSSVSGVNYLVVGDIQLDKRSTDTCIGKVTFIPNAPGTSEIIIIGSGTLGVEGAKKHFALLVEGSNENQLGVFKFEDANTNSAVNDVVYFYMSNIQVFSGAASEGQVLSQSGALMDISACADYGTIQYLQPTQCVTCVTPKVPDGSACKCSKGYYELITGGTISCEPCIAKNCLTCQTAEQCTTCPTGRTLSDGNCVCQNNKFDSNGVCIECKPECERCDTPNFCATCKSSYTSISLTTYFNVVPVSGNCVCQETYYLGQQGGLPYCIPCSTKCGNCVFQNGAVQCTSCKSGVIATQTGTQTAGGANIVTCSCSDGSYLKDDGTCGVCHYSCLTCSGSTASECKTCPSSRTSEVVGSGLYSCTCTAPQIDEANVKECKTADCSVLSVGCLTCSAQCLTCSVTDGFVSEPTAGQCVCKSGSKLVGATCQACPAGCKECDVNGCVGGCIDNAQPDGTSCKCVSKYYLDSAANMCRQCTVSDCATCTADGACSACVTPKIPLQSQCVCPTGYYTVTTTNPTQCVACSANCGSCTVLGCSQCRTGFVRDGVNCVATCSPGKYVSLGSCERCPTGCATCTDAITCTACQSGYFFYLNNCLTACPIGTLSNTATLPITCSKCQYPCATCSDNVTSCTSCTLGSGVLVGTTCKQSCKVKQNGKNPKNKSQKDSCESESGEDQKGLRSGSKSQDRNRR